MMTETSAKMRYCPFCFNNPEDTVMKCVAGKCMAWDEAVGYSYVGCCKLIGNTNVTESADDKTIEEKEKTNG